MELLTAYPEQTFRAGTDFMYDSADDIVYYIPQHLSKTHGQLALLHEIAHAQLGHFHYQTDFELFAMETKAWARTRALALKHALPITESYIDECLASYATWLTKRATCPLCGNFSLQTTQATYQCFRCQTRWRVGSDAVEGINQIMLEY